MSNTAHYEFTDGPAIDLSEFDSEFGAAQAPGYEEVPEGKYQAQIASVRLEKSKNGNPMIKWDLIVLSGSHAGRHIFKNSVITQGSLPFVKGDLKTAGLNLAKFSDLSARLEELLDVTLEIVKRTSGEYTNVYFNRRIDLASAGMSTGSADDSPF
jgi:hypothetical protein